MRAAPMATFASLQLMWLSFAVLNAVLALLLARARMGRTARVLVVSLFALNAGAALILLARDAGLPTGRSTGYYVNLLSLAPLALLPWFAPIPRLAPRGRALLVALAGGLTVWAVGRAVLVDDAVTFPAIVLFSLAPAVGCLVLADSHASAASPAQRSFAALLLAAYVLKSTVLALRWYTGTPWDLAFAPIHAIAVVLLGGALLTFAVGLGRRAIATRRIDASEGIVLVAFAAGIFLASTPVLDEAVEYLLLRPILIAYGIMSVAFAEVDIRERRGLLAIGILAVGAGLFASIMTPSTSSAPAPPDFGRVILAFLVALTAVGLLGWQLLSAMHGAVGEPRRLLVYRAALEASRSEGRGASAFDDLASLRRRLGITPPEHELLANDVNADVAFADLAPGRRFLDRYDVVREAGRGSAGVVYQAHDIVEGNDVAVKRLDLDRRDIAAIERLQQEATLSRAVEHPALVRTHRVEFLRGEAFLVMDYLPGGSVVELLQRRGRLSEAEALRLARDVLAGVEALHARGISHRDVKPGNILLDATGRAKLADFSLASEAVSGDTVGAGRAKTVGTVAYMAPEVARGVPWAMAADLYSVSATLYEMLSGRPPIDVGGLGEYEARRKVADGVPALPLDGVSAATNRALAKAMAPRPEDRYHRAAEMADALPDPAPRA